MTDTSKKPREFDLKQADEIADEYSRPYSMIDSGNLFFALGEYQGAYQSLQAEIEYLNRMLADERSGDCDKDKTIRRLESNYQSLLEQCEKLVEDLRVINNWGVSPTETAIAAFAEKTLAEFEAWKKEQGL